MSDKISEEMATQWDQSDRALERLYMRSSHAFGPLKTINPPTENSKKTSSKDRHKTNPKPEHVDIDKLSRLTTALHKTRGSPSAFVNYSQFAEENFDPHGNFTTPTKRGKHSSEKSKELYNEVQRSSLNFGVTSEEMKSYHKRKVSVLSDYSSQQSPQSPKPTLQLPKPPTQLENQKGLSFKDPDIPVLTNSPPVTPTIDKSKADVMEQKSQDHKLKQPRLQSKMFAFPTRQRPTPSPSPTHKASLTSGTAICVTPRRARERLPLEEATDATKRQGVLLEPFDSSQLRSKSSVLLTPQSDIIDTRAFDQSKEKLLVDSDSEGSVSENSPLLTEKVDSNPFIDDDPFMEKDGITKKDSNKSGHSTDGSSTSGNTSSSRLLGYRSKSQSSLGRSTFGTLFRKKSTLSIQSAPATRRECHRVEDTLLADKEFNDFSIAKRRSGSYYTKSLEFSFEKPNSRGASSQSSVISQSPRLSQLDSPNTNVNRHQSIHSFSTQQSSPRAGQRYSMSDAGSSGSTPQSSPVTPTRRGARPRHLLSRSVDYGLMNSPSSTKSTSMFDPIAEHERVVQYNDKPLQ